jgi:soluble lytic murein transglycosylase-like protein
MDYIAQQFQHAKINGWLPYFAKAGKDYDFDPALLMAIASRETNMSNIVGDGGHGYGLMQIDIRSFPEWVSSGAWREVGDGIEKGAQVLDQKMTQIHNGAGKVLQIGGYAFRGASFPTADSAIRVAVAAYNSGLWAYYCFSKGEDPDRLTTGRNYSADVLRRYAEFSKLLGGGA